MPKGLCQIVKLILNPISSHELNDNNISDQIKQLNSIYIKENFCKELKVIA
jgi:hypothetical protein